MQQSPSFNEMVEQSIKEHWDLDALSDYKGENFQYKDIARLIEKLHIIFEHSNVQQGDKIAICGRNSAHWGAVFFATLTYGAVAVPILHEFKAEQIHHIVNHSEAKLLFVGDTVWKELNADEMPGLEGIIGIADYALLVGRTEKVTYAREHLNQLFGERYPMNFRKHHISYYKDSPEEMAVLNYTSGTTSRSKGVMIPYRALWSNVAFAQEALGAYLKAGDNVLSMLPMAHMYGMAFEFLYEFCTGCHINFLTKNPSPNVLFAAFGDLKPRIVIAVPLIIEKIIRKAVLPKIQGTTVKMLLKIPVFIHKDSYMMIVACTYKITWQSVPLCIQYRNTIHVSFIMKCHGIAYTRYRYPFDGNPFLSVQPYRILIQIGKSFLGISTAFFKSGKQNRSHSCIYDFAYRFFIFEIF